MTRMRIWNQNTAAPSVSPSLKGSLLSLPVTVKSFRSREIYDADRTFYMESIRPTHTKIYEVAMGNESGVRGLTIA